ncbi:HlyD family efflux transporter periplasmic adaptor subunit [Aliiglaciecola lipolytica]|uniref:RND efflux pump membrane fusion protein barrel-sandwich domain-containing protein n=1 Tax=Aliiglaciecola lipolytica E3 TaxID=1127673 RepID=K6YGQ0_9ALTE|nr:HlyD family efflux transporter periplasmic adaptor subunit [Aliiglaciecola lipolytica]GAC15783.1 hypothetical protein GLIP_3162 [Aliiglaciecola lipolytica E3]
MKIHNRQSYLTSQSEGKPRNRKAPKLTQLIYFLVLAILFFYIVYFFVSRTLYITEVGFVEIQKTNISSERGGKIISIPLKEGEKFKKGALLATISAAKTCHTIVDKRVDNVAFDIDEQKIVLDGLLGELALLKQIQSENEKRENNAVRRALEINASLNSSRFDNLQDQLELKNKIALQRAKLANLESRMTTLGNQVDTTMLDPGCSQESILAPADGHVFALRRQSNEVVTRAEEILLMVADDADVFIEVYLEAELYKNIADQNTMEVTFPDGQESIAQILEVNSSAYTTPDREWNDYQPVVPNLQVKLAPKDESDIALWKKFDRYQVEVRGEK